MIRRTLAVVWTLVATPAWAQLTETTSTATTVLDDVAVLTKVSAKKTAGILGDDLALNAQQVAKIKRIVEDLGLRGRHAR